MVHKENEMPFFKLKFQYQSNKREESRQNTFIIRFFFILFFSRPAITFRYSLKKKLFNNILTSMEKHLTSISE